MKKVILTCPEVNSVQSIFSCQSALKNPNVYLFVANFSSSLLDTKICHNFSQSDEVFYRRHITISFISPMVLHVVVYMVVRAMLDLGVFRSLCDVFVDF